MEEPSIDRPGDCSLCRENEKLILAASGCKWQILRPTLHAVYPARRVIHKLARFARPTLRMRNVVLKPGGTSLSKQSRSFAV